MQNQSALQAETALSRRSFLGRSLGAAVIGAAQNRSLQAETVKPVARTGSAFLDILRLPDRAIAYAGLDHPLALSRSGHAWQAAGIEIDFGPGKNQMPIRLSSPGFAVTHLHLRWKTETPSALRCLGDHWERSYGDLEWRGLAPERAMPWYFATFDGAICNGYGVMTGAGSLCFWQLDQEGVSLWLNLMNGGEAVRLGNRQLLAATVVSRRGQAGEEPMQSVEAFCRRMCPNPRLPATPVYGTNDWYYAYGRNSAAQTLRDADLLAELSAGLAVRPYAVIDDGWHNAEAFPEMAALAAEVRKRNVRPGIWVRPLQAPKTADRRLLLADARYGQHRDRFNDLAFDPTIPEALEAITAKVSQVANWGFELVKHDFSTYELLGSWGFEMGASPTVAGWSLHDQSRTNAEVVTDLYRALRRAAGDQTLLLGCNTIGHLSAGIFEMQRTGDDTSGEHWERTRKMGVNTLAFRLTQNRTFFVQDPDCVGITTSIPWQMNRQWMDLIARSGAALFVSPDPRACGAEQKQAIAAAFAMAAAGGSHARPEDWLLTTTPEEWKGTAQGKTRYRWCEDDGASPFGA